MYHLLALSKYYLIWELFSPYFVMRRAYFLHFVADKAAVMDLRGFKEENTVLSPLSFQQLMYVQLIHSNLVSYCHLLGFSVLILKGYF